MFVCVCVCVCSLPSRVITFRIYLQLVIVICCPYSSASKCIYAFSLRKNNNSNNNTYFGIKVLFFTGSIIEYIFFIVYSVLGYVSVMRPSSARNLYVGLMFSINLNLKTFRLLNCLHMIFLHCILRYLISL